METHIFEVRDDFYLDGKPFKIISGAVHYFRVVPEYWADRLERLKAMGCNTVETYVAWNMHEPKKGEFRFTGMLDIVSFINTARRLGLWVIVRPGPYICGEWELGGLPAWLLADDGMRLRTSYAPFLKHLEDYWAVLLPMLAPLQAQNGGPVILMQAENEYGYYGDDALYIEAVRDMFKKYGIDEPLVTSDGPDGDSLACGSVRGALPTANFGSRAGERMRTLERYLDNLGGGPQMCMEFWVGWFDSWGVGPHRTVEAAANAADIDKILKKGSVNIYMFHGGTNFGFMNGSNYYGRLAPDTTSYDYDAPLSEDGRTTEKYEVLKSVIAKYVEIPEVKFSTHIARKGYGKFKVEKKVSLFKTLERISAKQDCLWPLPMEKLGQGYGYTLYRTVTGKSGKIEKFRLLGANDRAQVFVDEALRLTLYDRELLEEYEADWFPGGEIKLDILTENMGRVNFGPLLDSQRKGIDGAVLLNGRSHSGWQHYPLPLDEESLRNLNFEAGWAGGQPSFYKIGFEADKPADTFLDLELWGKGCAFVNGFNIGRFWEAGPQKRLYIPAPLIKAGRNELIIFETEGKAGDYVIFAGEPDLG